MSTISSISNIIGSYRAANYSINFMSEGEEITAEKVFQSTVEKFRLEPSVFKIKAIPITHATSPKKIVKWLLDNQYIPNVVNNKILFSLNDQGRLEESFSSNYVPLQAIEAQEKELKELFSSFARIENKRERLELVLKLAQLQTRKESPESLIQAVGIYNYALSMDCSEAEKKSVLSLLSEIENKLAKICQENWKKEFLSIGGSTNLQESKSDRELSLPPLQTSREIQRLDTHNREKLASIRKAIKDRFLKATTIEEYKEVFSFSTEEMKCFARTLLEQAISVLGDPPCAFSLIAFGSFARDEATPFSDLECGFLIAESPHSEKFATYFENLTYLFHIRILNLGETILPNLAIPALENFFDSEIPRGFSLDGGAIKACKTPLGKKESFKLIQTPKKMAEFQWRDFADNKLWYQKEPFLPLEIQSVTLIHTNSESHDLLNDYKNFVKAELDLPPFGLKNPLKPEYKHLSLGESLRETFAKFQLAPNDFLTFNIKLRELNARKKTLHIKNDLYRIPQLLLHRIGLFYGVEGLSTWEQIKALREKNPLFFTQLEEILCRIIRLRFDLYFNFGFQKGEIDLSSLPTFEGLSQENLISELQWIFQNLIPLFRVSPFGFHGNIEELKLVPISSKEDFAGIALHLFQDQEAESYLLEAAREDPENGNVYKKLALIAFYHKNFEQAKVSLDQGIIVSQRNNRPFETAMFAGFLGIVLKNINPQEYESDIIGCFGFALGTCPQERKDLKSDLYKELATFQAEIGLNADSARNFALSVQAEPSDLADPLDKADTCLRSSLAAELTNDLPTAYAKILEGLKILKTEYPESHPQMMKMNNQLARILFNQKKYIEAQQRIKKNLYILDNTTHQIESSLAREIQVESLLLDGYINFNRNYLDKALSSLERAKNIHIQNSSSPSNLANDIFSLLGHIHYIKDNFPKALDHFLVAFEALKNRPSERASLNKLAEKITRCSLLMPFDRSKEEERDRYIETLERCLKSEYFTLSSAPVKVMVYHQLGSTYVKNKKHDQAEAAFKKALQCSPNKGTYAEYGQLLCYLKNYQEAENIFCKSLNHQEDSLVSFDAQDLEVVDADLKKSIETNGPTSVSSSFLCCKGLVVCYLNLGQFNKAEEYFQVMKRMKFQGLYYTESRESIQNLLNNVLGSQNSNQSQSPVDTSLDK